MTKTRGVRQNKKHLLEVHLKKLHYSIPVFGLIVNSSLTGNADNS